MLIAWIAVLVYAFPGYMNYDVGQQLIEIREGPVTDFHPPLMGGYWRVLEVFVCGPFPMLLLQTSLFAWGLYSLLRSRLDKRTSAWTSAALLLFPPILTPMAMIWKDAQMSAFLVAGTALVLKRPTWARAAGVALFVIASGVRFNGGAALPLLCLVGAATWTSRGRLAALGIALALTLGAIASARVVNDALTEKPGHTWYRTTAIMDIVGTICFAPPLSDAEILELLDGIELKQTTAIQRAFCERYPAGKGVIGNPPWYAYSELFAFHPTKIDRQARMRAWRTLILKYPQAYLHHRMTISMDLLGVAHARVWEPVGQDFAGSEDQLRAIHHDHFHSWLQRHAGDAFRWLVEHTPLYRVFVYAVLCIVFFAWAVWKRDMLVLALTGSGLLYELSLAIGVNAPDFRYSHWLITCTCVSAVLIVIARRDERRAARETAAPPRSPDLGSR